MKIPLFIVIFAVFIFGMWMMGHAFTVDTYNLEWFLGGILVVSLSIAIPAHMLGRSE